jgi:hypothetical protein
MYTAVRFYVTQCSAEYPFDFLDVFKGDLEAATIAFADLDLQIANNVTMESLVAQCGTDAEGLDTLLSSMKSELSDLETKVAGVEASLSCDVVVPTFTSTTYYAACGTTMNSLYYGYVCKFVGKLCCGRL